MRDLRSFCRKYYRIYPKREWLLPEKAAAIFVAIIIKCIWLLTSCKLDGQMIELICLLIKQIIQIEERNK